MRKEPVHIRENSPKFVLTDPVLGLVFNDMIFPGVPAY